MFTNTDKMKGLMRTLMIMAVFSVVTGCQQAEETVVGSSGSASPGVSDIITLAVSGIGGEEALAWQ